MRQALRSRHARLLKISSRGGKKWLDLYFGGDLGHFWPSEKGMLPRTY